MSVGGEAREYGIIGDLYYYCIVDADEENLGRRLTVVTLTFLHPFNSIIAQKTVTSLKNVRKKV